MIGRRKSGEKDGNDLRGTDSKDNENNIFLDVKDWYKILVGYTLFPHPHLPSDTSTDKKYI